MPTQYIYEPWTAPASVQKQVGCIIGKDYPDRIVIHEEVSKENMARMKAAYQAGKKGTPSAVKVESTSGLKRPAGEELPQSSSKKK